MTPADSPVLDAERRAWNYWLADGLSSLVAGVSCLLLALCIFAAALRPKDALTATLASLGLLLYIVCLCRMKAIIEWLKARITYPRTGYAAPPYFTNHADALPPDITMLSLSSVEAERSLAVSRLHQDRKWRTWLMLAIVAAGALATRFVPSTWVCLAVGLVIGLALWLITRKNERASWIEIVAFPVTGLYLFLLPVSKVARLDAFLIGGGIALVLSGAFRLIRYLRQNPAPNA